jgi:hypothetical protein
MIKATTAEPLVSAAPEEREHELGAGKTVAKPPF